MTENEKKLNKLKTDLKNIQYELSSYNIHAGLSPDTLKSWKKLRYELAQKSISKKKEISSMQQMIEGDRKEAKSKSDWDKSVKDSPGPEAEAKAKAKKDKADKTKKDAKKKKADDEKAKNRKKMMKIKKDADASEKYLNKIKKGSKFK